MLLFFFLLHVIFASRPPEFPISYPAPIPENCGCEFGYSCVQELNTQFYRCEREPKLVPSCGVDSDKKILDCQYEEFAGDYRCRCRCKRGFLPTCGGYCKAKDEILP